MQDDVIHQRESAATLWSNILLFQHMYSFASCHAVSSDIDTFLPSVCSFLEKWKTQNERASKQTVNLHWNVSLLRT